MSTQDPEDDVGVTAATAWLMAWAVGFVALGFNHLLTHQPDSLRLFLVAGVLSTFLASLWFVSAQPHSSVALASNLITLAAILVASVLVSRNPALMVLRWTSGQQDVALFASSVWVAIIWLSIICAGGVAEVHHVFQSRAR